MERSLRKGRSRDRLKVEPNSKAMESSQMTHQAAERVGSRNFHTTNRQKQLNPVVELEKTERS